MKAKDAPVRLLLVDDDEPFRERLAVAMARRGYEVLQAGSVERAFDVASQQVPDAVVVDLKMPGGNGLDLVAGVKARWPNTRVVVLTGYGSIGTAMEAVRLGAMDYITKPADADQIHEALGGTPREHEVSTPTLDRVEWEHLQRVLADCNQNISKTARVLGIDRRSLQRKLSKYPPPR